MRGGQSALDEPVGHRHLAGHGSQYPGARERAVYDEALAAIESAPFLTAAEKTRLLEGERARIDRFGVPEAPSAAEAPEPIGCD